MACQAVEAEVDEGKGQDLPGDLASARAHREGSVEEDYAFPVFNAKIEYSAETDRNGTPAEPTWKQDLHDRLNTWLKKRPNE